MGKPGTPIPPFQSMPGFSLFYVCAPLGKSLKIQNTAVCQIGGREEVVESHQTHLLISSLTFMETIIDKVLFDSPRGRGDL